MKPLTIYLLTAEHGDFHTYPVTLRAYSSRGPTSKLDKLLRRLDAFYKRKQEIIIEDSPDWYEQLRAWGDKHPLPGYEHLNRSDFKVQVIQLR